MLDERDNDSEIYVVNEELQKYANVVIRGKVPNPRSDVIVAVYSNYDEKTVDIFEGFTIEKVIPYLNKPGYNVTAYTKDGGYRLKIIGNGSLLHGEDWCEY